MEPKIAFLGTGGDALVVSKQLRASGGILLSLPDLQIHIDPGPSALTELRRNRFNVRETSCILVSHQHINHSNDVNAIIQGITLGGLDKTGVLVTDESATSIVSDYHKGCLERVILLQPEQRVGVGEVEVVALPTFHSVPGIGFKIITETFTLAYSADTAYNEKLCTAYADADILILNVVSPFGLSSEHNLSSDDAVKILSKVKPKLVIITHFGIKMIDEDPIYQAREMHHRTGIPIIAAEDGTVINPWAYAIHKQQKRLNSF